MATEPLATAQTPEGGELCLYRAHGGDYVLRVDGWELATSRGHASEEALGELACTAVSKRGAPRVLVGGLGMGFTLAAALRVLPRDAQVTVAEIVPAVVAWNRDVLAPLSGHALEDSRVTVETEAVQRCIEATPGPYDAVLLDVDNGPEALSRAENAGIYTSAGLESIRRSLRPGGFLATWSAQPNPELVGRLHAAGWALREHRIPARGPGGGPEHYVWLARADGEPWGC